MSPRPNIPVPGFSQKAPMIATTTLAGFLTKQEKPAFEALCRRLGISSGFDDLTKWIMVGWLLAKEQPEFTKKRGRGRPSVGKSGVDYQRARVIKARRRELIAAGQSERASDVSLIRKLADSDHRLFPQTIGIDALEASVSRGNKVWREAEAEVQRLQKKSAALERASKRNEARRQEEKRKQDEVGGIFGLLGPLGPLPDSATDPERSYD